MSQGSLRSAIRALVVNALPPVKRRAQRLQLIRAHLDVEYYRQRYPDTASLDAALHYHKSGWREGYNPTAWFDTNSYLAANPDVREAGIDPFLHYLQYGEAERRVLPKRTLRRALHY